MAIDPEKLLASLPTIPEVWEKGNFSLKKCCSELIEWKNTGILPDGDLRTFALCLEHKAGFPGNCLEMAERYVMRLALEYVNIPD